MASDRPVLSDRALAIVAENKIRAAMDAGEFDNLPGLGQPSPLIDEPYDPHWWIRRKLKDEGLASARLHQWALIRKGENVLDGMIEHRKQSVDREQLRANLKLTTEERIRKLQKRVDTEKRTCNSTDS